MESSTVKILLYAFVYNTQADFRPKFGGKKEVHMHNMHIYFYNATE